MNTKTLYIAENTSKQLVLKTKRNVDYLMVYLLLPILIFSFSVAFFISTENAIILFVGFPLGLSVFNFMKTLALDTITFYEDLIVVGYRRPFKGSSDRYYLEEVDLNWFVEVKGETALIQIGHKSNIVADFILENTSDLLLLTESVANLSNLELSNSQTIGKVEAMQFRNRDNPSISITKDYFEIQRTADKLDFITKVNQGFWIDLKQGTLNFHQWYKLVEVDLNDIRVIRYKIEPNKKMAMVRFQYLLKNENKVNEIFNVELEYKKHPYYSRFSINNEIEYLVNELKNEPFCKHIKMVKI